MTGDVRLRLSLPRVDQRYYASAYGRFNTPDPSMSSIDPANPMSLSRYSYVLGDPVNHSDRHGLEQDCVEDDDCCDPDYGCECDPCDPSCGAGDAVRDPTRGLLPHANDSCGGGGGSPPPKKPKKKKNLCDPNDPTNAKVLSFISANSAAASAVSAASGLSAAFVLAWGGMESLYGTTGAATVNNNFYGLTNGQWAGIVSCPSNASSTYVCFSDPGLLDSAESALTSFGDKYLKAGLAAQANGGTIADIAQAMANAGFNSEYGPGVYGSKVNDAAQAIAARENCP